MRGTIEVLAEDTRPAAPTEPPLYVMLGMDIDAPHTAEVIPDKRPSPAQGADLPTTIPADYWGRERYESQSPSQLWQQLRHEPSTADLTDAELWDLIGFLWQSQTTPTAWQLGQELYTADCASCHGTSGAGDGPLATIQPVPVPDFTDPTTMLGANSAILQGKLLRGGMGTGMPNWGTIFTEEEIWALVDYLWTFQFALEENTE
jgi:cytochrome c5